MQMRSMNNQYSEDRQQQEQGGRFALGAGMKTGGPLMLNSGLGKGEFGRSSLQDMAERMARSYGLNFGRGSLIDSEGNFLSTPDQLASQGGGELDTVAANMNRIAQAINDRQVQQQQNKATASLQAGLGQVQQRGRGSLAALQSGFYQQMAANYTNPNLLPEQADFSFWIQKAGFDEAARNRQKEDDKNRGGGGGSGGGGGRHYSGAKMVSRKSAHHKNATVSGPEGLGDIITSGPHKGQRPFYTYDPVNQTTTVSFRDA